ncbi:MAG TPA: peptidase domain-containing ABC transporter [Flavisolibacter sp.]|nr:peptidase domain-containing ABC transporter [Flavisolibacter sp.]
MRFHFYKQPDAMDCGPTCLRMVAKYYRKVISLQTLRERTQIGKEGVNLLGISEAAESIGFRTKAVKISYEQLVSEVTLPTILHWDQNHYVVLYAIKHKSIFRKEQKFSVADPGRGLISYSSAEFKRYWVSDKIDTVEEGIALLLEPTQSLYNTEKENLNENSKSLGFPSLLNYILPYRKLVLQLFIGIGIGSLLQLFLPFLTQSIVDVGINTANMHFIYIILLAQLALFAGRVAVEFIRSWILLHISTRINVSILTDFLIKLMKLPVSFFDSKRTGDILQRMNDHSRIESFLTGNSLNTLFSLLNLVVLSVILIVFNVSLFFVFAIASLAYAIWVFLFLKKRKELDHKRFAIAAKEQGATIQLVQGMQEIKLNGAERAMHWNWEGLQARLFKLNMKTLSLNQWQQSGAFFINEGKNIFITFLSAQAVIAGQMTLGTMLAVQYIIGQLNAPIEQMISFIQSWQNAKISMERLNEVHNLDDEESELHPLQQQLPPSFTRQIVGGTFHEKAGLLSAGYAKEYAVEDSLSAFDTSPIENNLQLRNVSFIYPGAGNLPTLRNITLSIPKGKITAIVGASGSGKTTLLKLLLRFYEPQKGEIKLDRTSLNSISHKVWRSHCGVVMQESFIFSDTIARNIAVGVEKVDKHRLQLAVEVANLQDFIESLPLGYNTMIGTEGIGISMGQKQRILIARAVYRDPQFIFLDEATNSLDANNEVTIVNNLQDFFKGRTVIVVAHRLSTVRHADQIIVLHKGIITERGTHQELVNLKGDYFNLVKNQLELAV